MFAQARTVPAAQSVSCTAIVTRAVNVRNRADWVDGRVTAGLQSAKFFWIQSMVRDDATRSLLFDLDLAIQRLGADVPDHPSVVQLTSVYHNLLRRWAEM